MKSATMLVYILLMIFTCCKCEPHFRFLANVEKELESKLDSFHNDESDHNKHCVCYNKSGPSVADAMNADLQRLVVYLYRDAHNNMKVYTPSKQKQLLLPDLDLGKDDLFIDVNSKSIHQLYNPKIAVELRRKHVTNVNIHDSNPSNHHIFGNLLHYLNSEVKTNLPNGQFKEDLELGFHDKSIKVDIPSAEIDVDVGIPSLDVSTNINPELKFGLPSAITGVVNSFPRLDVVLNNSSPTTKLTVLDKESPIGQVTKDESLKKNKNLDGTSSWGSVNILSSIKGPHLFASKDINVPVIKNTDTLSIDNPNIFHLNMDTKNFGVDGKFSVKQPLNGFDVTSHNYVTFDKWFEQQMQRIKNTGQSPNKVLDLSSLKQLIMKTLYDNEMYVTMDGVLVDSKGEALNVANLKLRPILIGDSVAYDNIFNKKGNSKYELPSNLPYLEAILITLVNPPKVLGVIPLGKTYVPRVSYRRNYNYFDLTSGNRGSACRDGKCLQNTYNGCKTERCLQNMKAYYQVLHHNYPQSRLTYRHGSVKKNAPKMSESDNSNGNTQALPRYQRKHEKRIVENKPRPPQNNKFDLSYLLRSFLGIGNNNDNQFASSDDKGNNEYEDVSEEKWPEEEDHVDEVPWFRIIGGNAATSSGTPVSSKGRSGRPYYYY